MYVGKSTLMAAILGVTQMIIGFGVMNAPEDGSKPKVLVLGM